MRHDSSKKLSGKPGAIHPKIGRIVPEFDDESIREIIHKPFRVVYLLKGEMIYVIRVWRGERLLILSDEEK